MPTPKCSMNGIYYNLLWWVNVAVEFLTWRCLMDWTSGIHQPLEGVYTSRCTHASLECRSTLSAESQREQDRKSEHICCTGSWVLWPKKPWQPGTKGDGAKAAAVKCVSRTEGAWCAVWPGALLPPPRFSFPPLPHPTCYLWENFGGGSSQRRKYKFAILMHKGNFLQTILAARKRPPAPAAPPEAQGASFSILVSEIISWREASYFKSKLFSS